MVCLICDLDFFVEECCLSFAFLLLLHVDLINNLNFNIHRQVYE